MCYLDFLEDKVHRHDFIPVKLISYGPSISIDEAMSRAKISGHGAIDKVEGVVWRCEKNGNVDFLAKYVRGDKEDGLYLPERNSEYTEPTWNTFPGVEKYIKKLKGKIEDFCIFVAQNHFKNFADLLLI